MTLSRWVGVWLMLLVGGTAIEVTSVSRAARLAESLGDANAGHLWADLPATLTTIYIGLTVAYLPFLLLGVPGRLNQSRARRTATTDHDGIVRGVWNLTASDDRGGPLFDVPRFSAISTVLVATSEGIQLASGVFTLIAKAQFSWNSVDDITVVHLAKRPRVLAGPGIAIRLREFDEPLVFSVVVGSFPWFAIGSLQFTEETASSLRALSDAARDR